MKLSFLKPLAVAMVLSTSCLAHAGFAERDAKTTSHLLQRGFSIQESTISGLLEFIKTNRKVGDTVFNFSPILQLQEFLPFSPAALNDLLTFIERSEAKEFNLQQPEELIRLIFKSTLLPSDSLNRMEQIAKNTKNKSLKLTLIKNLMSRNFKVEAMTKSLVLLSLDLEETISLPAALELLKTHESKWAEERIEAHLAEEKPRLLLNFLLRNGDHFEDMSDALVLEILKAADVKARESLLIAMQYTQFHRAQKMRRAVLTKVERCLLYLNPF